MFDSFKKFLSPEELGIRNSQRADGVGADTLLRTLSPIMLERQNELLLKLFQCPPKLEEFLDIRAQLKEVHRINHELIAVSARGKEASEALGEIFS